MKKAAIVFVLGLSIVSSIGGTALAYSATIPPDPYTPIHRVVPPDPYRN